MNREEMRGSLYMFWREKKHNDFQIEHFYHDIRLVKRQHFLENLAKVLLRRDKNGYARKGI
jgi:hypothetical protein